MAAHHTILRKGRAKGCTRVATLNKFKVGEREKKEVLGALGPMKADIVTAM